MRFVCFYIFTTLSWQKKALKRCPKCYSNRVKCNGTNSTGKQKFKCLKCMYCFVHKYRKTPQVKWDKLFLQWLFEGYSVRQLADQHKKSRQDILLYIRSKLTNPICINIDEIFSNVRYVMIDWTWIGNICVIVYYKYVLKKVLRIWLYDTEWLVYMKADLLHLRDVCQYKIGAFVVDGWLQIASAIKSIYPQALMQRCLVHIHRKVRTYISQHPKHECARELLWIVTFECFKSKEKFIRMFDSWCKKWHRYLAEKTTTQIRWRYTHRKIRQARSHIKNALPHMFHWLHDENISRDTNDLEWLFGIFSEHIYDHRWLSKERLHTFIIDWFYYRNYRAELLSK